MKSHCRLTINFRDLFKPTFTLKVAVRTSSITSNTCIVHCFDYMKL